MQPNDIKSAQYVSTSELFQIVEYYMIIMRQENVAYGNGFDKYGKRYLAMLCRYFPEFSLWFGKNYPNSWAAVSKECQIASDWSPEISNSINVLLGYRA